MGKNYSIFSNFPLQNHFLFKNSNYVLDKIKKHINIINIKVNNMEVDMKKMPTKCPACGATLEITELKCPKCGTVIKGNFPINKFLSLNSEALEFLVAFLKSRGSIKEVQERLGISYPTAKNRLDKLLSSLGFSDGKKAVNKMSVLDALERGEITAKEAIELLKGSEKNGEK